MKRTANELSMFKEATLKYIHAHMHMHTHTHVSYTHTHIKRIIRASLPRIN